MGVIIRVGKPAGHGSVVNFDVDKLALIVRFIEDNDYSTAVEYVDAYFREQFLNAFKELVDSEFYPETKNNALHMFCFESCKVFGIRFPLEEIIARMFFDLGVIHSPEWDEVIKWYERRKGGE